MSTRWGLFAAATLGILASVLALSWATQRALAGTDGDAAGTPDSTERTAPDRVETADGFGADDPDLLVSAAVSQALVGVLLAGVAVYARVPFGTLGITDPERAVLPGLALGLGLYGANEAGAWLAARVGVESDEALRELLAPETRGEWVLLLAVVLPLVALVEELLFRGAVVGALAAGFGVSPWLLAVFSSVAFGLGHGLQGPGGILVTGILGFALAAAFIHTGSLWVVVLAHYIVNALEFLVREGLGIDPVG